MDFRKKSNKPITDNESVPVVVVVSFVGVVSSVVLVISLHRSGGGGTRRRRRGTPEDLDSGRFARLAEYQEQREAQDDQVSQW